MRNPGIRLTVLDKLNVTARIEGYPDDELVKVVLLDRKMIWMWVPKVAGSSTSKALLSTYGERAIACHIPLDLIWRLNPEYRSFEVVGFKRNPYTRTVSCWASKLTTPQAIHAPYLRKVRYAGLRHGMPFGEFAAWLNTPAGSDEVADQHWISQHLLLQRADRLLPYEELSGSIAELGLGRIPRNNVRAVADARLGVEHRPAISHYDAQSYADITRRFAKDLEVLGYSYPGEPPTA